MKEGFYPSDEYDSELDERRFKEERAKSKRKWWDLGDDDDDDPPPAPVASRLPGPVPLVDGARLIPAA